MKFTLCIGILIFFQLWCGKLTAQHLNNLIPTNTATHTAILDGSWFDPNIWDTATVPGDAAIVVIPAGRTVNYEGQSSAHIFAIRVDGTFLCTQSNANSSSSITFDTFIGTMSSNIQFHAQNPSDGSIDIIISPFDIEGHKTGTTGFSQLWNANALSHFSDGAAAFLVEKEVIGSKRYNSYADALAGGNHVQEISRTPYDDGTGVVGRYGWDSTQLSLGIVTMGEIEILGQPKLAKSMLAADAPRQQNSLILSDIPTGWEVGDSILITRDGNLNTSQRGEDVAVIAAINDSAITCQSNLQKNHFGHPTEGLHCYVGNLSRNITIRSADPSHINRRGHSMFMHNSSNVQIRNAAFKDLGRTDKSRLTDDFIWGQWLPPKVFQCKISALGQEVCEMQRNPAMDITNSRGRYSIHLHKTGANLGDNMVFVTGNVVWRNPGWGITHHDSYATVSDNVVYDVVGAGIVSESGSELGFWDNNLVVDIRQGHTSDKYEAQLFHDDLLFSGQGLGLRGRGVVCRNNVIANAREGVGVLNMNPSISNLDRVDPQLLAIARPQHQVDHFPLDRNGYSIEGDGVLPVEVALILENTTAIWCYQGLRSIERDMGVNHESRSIFDGYKIWGCNQGLSIPYQADYSFKDVYISGKNLTNTIGMFLWKHSHNHLFENIKLENLSYGITVSKLVESGTGLLKTRNNGQTPWVFIDLELQNVGNLYQITKEDPSTPTVYSEHNDNPIILTSAELSSRPTSFTIIDSSELVVDVAAGDFRFEVDGIITDDAGSYLMGIKQAEAQGNLRIDYPQRIYEFASQAKFEEYLTNHGVYQDTSDNGQLYFIIHEYLPNRRNYQYTSFPIRVKINNAPNSGVYANAQIEPALYQENPYQLISRRATVSQSSTQSGVSYFEIADSSSNPIDVSAGKAIDGNVNGRINCQIFQRGLVPIGSFSQTEIETEPWYDLDFGDTMLIDFIDIWNTVDLNGADQEMNSSHFTNFYILISNTPFTGMNLSQARSNADYEYFEAGLLSTMKRKASFEQIGAIGRYMRIQAVGTNKLQFAEIEVIGKAFENMLLPVELLLFEAQAHPNGRLESLLSWQTLTEENTDRFELEHSLDGVTFETVGRVPASGNSTTARSYEWNHSTPILGDNYYRLRTIDLGGSVSYSQIRRVRFEQEQRMQLYPNPASNFLILSLHAPVKEAYLTITNLQGQAVHSPITLLNDTQWKLNTSNLATGTYIATVVFPQVGKVLREKFKVVR